MSQPRSIDLISWMTTKIIFLILSR